MRSTLKYSINLILALAVIFHPALSFSADDVNAAGDCEKETLNEDQEKIHQFISELNREILFGPHLKLSKKELSEILRNDTGDFRRRPSLYGGQTERKVPSVYDPCSNARKEENPFDGKLGGACFREDGFYITVFRYGRFSIETSASYARVNQFLAQYGLASESANNYLYFRLRFETN